MRLAFIPTVFVFLFVLLGSPQRRALAEPRLVAMPNEEVFVFQPTFSFGSMNNLGLLRQSAQGEVYRYLPERGELLARGNFSTSNAPWFTNLGGRGIFWSGSQGVYLWNSDTKTFTESSLEKEFPQFECEGCFKIGRAVELPGNRIGMTFVSFKDGLLHGAIFDGTTLKEAPKDSFEAYLLQNNELIFGGQEGKGGKKSFQISDNGLSVLGQFQSNSDEFSLEIISGSRIENQNVTTHVFRGKNFIADSGNLDFLGNAIYFPVLESKEAPISSYRLKILKFIRGQVEGSVVWQTGWRGSLELSGSVFRPQARAMENGSLYIAWSNKVWKKNDADDGFSPAVALPCKTEVVLWAQGFSCENRFVTHDGKSISLDSPIEYVTGDNNLTLFGKNNTALTNALVSARKIVVLPSEKPTTLQNIWFELDTECGTVLAEEGTLVKCGRKAREKSLPFKNAKVVKKQGGVIWIAEPIFQSSNEDSPPLEMRLWARRVGTKAWQNLGQFPMPLQFLSQANGISWLSQNQELSFVSGDDLLVQQVGVVPNLTAGEAAVVSGNMAIGGLAANFLLGTCSRPPNFTAELCQTNLQTMEQFYFPAPFVMQEIFPLRQGALVRTSNEPSPFFLWRPGHTLPLGSWSGEFLPSKADRNISYIVSWNGAGEAAILKLTQNESFQLISKSFVLDGSLKGGRPLSPRGGVENVLQLPNLYSSGFASQNFSSGVRGLAAVTLSDDGVWRSDSGNWGNSFADAVFVNQLGSPNFLLAARPSGPRGLAAELTTPQGNWECDKGHLGAPFRSAGCRLVGGQARVIDRQEDWSLGAGVLYKARLPKLAQVEGSLLGRDSKQDAFWVSEGGNLVRVSDDVYLQPNLFKRFANPGAQSIVAVNDLFICAKNGIWLRRASDAAVDGEWQKASDESCVGALNTGALFTTLSPTGVSLWANKSGALQSLNVSLQSSNVSLRLGECFSHSLGFASRQRTVGALACSKGVALVSLANFEVSAVSWPTNHIPTRAGRIEDGFVPFWGDGALQIQLEEIAPGNATSAQNVSFMFWRVD